MDSRSFFYVSSATALAAAVSLLVACGGGGGGGSSSDDGGNTTNASTTGVQSSASGSQSATVASNASGSIRNMSSITLSSAAAGAPAYRSPLAEHSDDARFSKIHSIETKAVHLPKMHLAAALGAARARVAGAAGDTTVPTTSQTCDQGGDYTFSGTTNSTSGAFNMTFTYTDCRMDMGGGEGELLNGTLTSSSTDGQDFSMTMGNGNSTLEDTIDFKMQLYSANFTNMYASMVSDLSITGTQSYDQATGGYTFSFTANGLEKLNDFSEVYTLTYTNFVLNSSMTANGGTDTVSGAFSEAWSGAAGSESVAMTYTNLAIGWQTLMSGTTATGFSTTIDGGVSLNFTPDNCAEGTFTLDTTTPIVETYASGHTTAGVLKVNGTTTITYNADGSVTVSDGSGSTTYDTVEEMEALCPIEDMEDDTTSTDSDGTGSATADSMLITLSWTGGETSDMDLHVNYYNTTSPTASTALTSFINYWGDAWCTSPLDSNVSWEGMDLNADGICEAGLDFDDTEGYGPEHVTATSLPDGYYVVSVNSFSLDTDPSATVSVTIDVGGTLFTFDTHQFTVDDGEGTDPASWYRVADIRVSNGTATVVAPNTALNPWVDAMYKTRTKTKAK